MHININVFSATALVIACIFTTTSEATKDGVQHCNDKIRGLIENSCKTIMLAHKQRQDKREDNEAYPSIVKRENDFEPDYYVRYLDGESYEDIPKSHRLYDVRHKSYPSGAHLIVNKCSAKLLHAGDSDYIVEQRPVYYRSHAGKLIKDTTNRHKRNSHKRDISHKIAGCCENDIGCLLALCVVRH